MNIQQVNALAGSEFVNFTLSNSGSLKFWNYENFDVIIEYDANIGGIKTKTVEQLVFDRDSSFLGGTLPIPPTSGIEFDAVTPFNGNCNPCNFTHAVGAGSNQIIIVGVSPKGGTTVSDVWYDDLPLNRIRSEVHPDNNAESSLWYRIAPSTGSNTVSVDLSSAEEVAIGAISLNNIDQADPIGAVNGDTGTDATPTVDVVTTVANSWIIDDVNTQAGPMTNGTGQTEQWDINEGSTRGAGSTEETTTTGSYTMSWTNAAGEKEWSISAAEIKPSVGGSGNTTCNTNAFFATNDWIIGTITNDIMDPLLINTDEVAIICTKLSYPIFANGDVQITISTDLGHTASKSLL